MSKLIEIKNLSKSYSQGKNQLKILNKISLTVNSGENIALVGPSGCGKSTFLKIVGLLDQADSGEINLNKENYAKANDKKRTLFRKENIGFIYQFHYLLPEFTALENVMLPLLINGNSKQSAAKESKKILTSLGLKNRIDHKPSTMSGGEQQRVSIARSLIHTPQLLLADEPTGNLDPSNADKVFDIFFNEIKKRQQTTIVVTHNIELAQKLDQVITIKDGKITSFS